MSQNCGNLLSDGSHFNEIYSFVRKPLKSHYSSLYLVFISVFGPNANARKPPWKTGGIFGLGAEAQLGELSSADFFLFGGWRSPVAGDEGDEFGEVSIDVSETAIGVGEGLGDLQEDRRVAVLTCLRCSFEEATGEPFKLGVFLFDVVAFGVVQQGVFGAADHAKIGNLSVVRLAHARAVFVEFAFFLQPLGLEYLHVSRP